MTIEADSIATVMQRLASDGTAYAKAEIAYAKAVASERAEDARLGLMLAIVAAALALAALVAMLVGLVWILSLWIGPLGATAVVVGGSFAVAGFLAWKAVSMFKRVLSKPGKDA